MVPSKGEVSRMLLSCQLDISILGKVLRGSVALMGLNLAGIRSQPHMSPHVHYARLKFRLQAYVILAI